ncbi:MAG: hypothetical protein UU65_C0003G0183 [candidate division CPR2 bacterium GW2011_GWC1_41_48]|uniref:Uncharacterized protein n=1 Tax=candidate division CPR2 bacterium GW2011_GWC1_41_48 TaxID=1618344 RepID=A0A0G0Z7Y8_UNCC2|nr:MAG: hypothetical protein UT47_C0003G0189 [candidate division CPR2 bacterium GW2011_GWC2_39_35]KKR28597.1 MAG: hypothetical protein UT59_C0023G0003 [candidate division CPR2 bacterium GW2011_GWD1_39_7]KKR29228.1 MAG: hypothetical protein UT60_C0005G0033 [candidate division CPR2 bacterium GW2011_GWD2_39_7]KKS09128.1 MAG: hypothetical protein UU65_C0003G0183 [candidate division CPR2 bacterium GW2011_GWC1_41_48]
MKRKLILRTIKIQSAHKKNAPGFAYAYEYHPDKEANKDKGSIFGVIEILGNAESSKVIAEIVLDSVKEAYYESNKQEALPRFEYALGRVNEALVEAAEDGKIAWLGKLSAVIAVLREKELHVTQTGGAQAHLLRKKNFIQITEGLSPKGALHPLKTFVNIASGSVDRGDKLVFFTPSLNYNISKEELKNELIQHTPSVAVNTFYNILEDVKSQNRLSFMVLEITDPEALANDTLDFQDEFWLDEPKNVTESVVTSASPLIDKVAHKSKDALKMGKNIKERFGHVKIKIAKVAGKATEKAKAKREHMARNRTTNRNSNQASVFPMSVKMRKKNISFKRFLPGLKYIKKDYLKIGIYGVGIAAFLFIGSNFLSKEKKQPEENNEIYQVYLSDAAAKENDALTKIIAGDKNGGKADLDKAREAIEKVENSKFKDQFSEEIKTLRQKLQDILDQIDGIVKVNPEEMLALDKQFDKIVYGSKNFYLISEAGVGKVAIQSKDVVFTDNSSTDTLGADILEDGTIVFMTAEPMVYGFSGKEIKRQSLPVGEWYKAKDMIAYYSNIYVLGDDGQIYKHQRIVDGFTKPTPYFQENLSLRDGISLTIDSSIYVLLNDGQVSKFSTGKKQDFSLKGSPKMEKPKLIYTSESLSNIYIFDEVSSKILVFDKSGNFVKQMTSESFKGITSLTSDASGNIYVLVGKKVFKLPS